MESRTSSGASGHGALVVLKPNMETTEEELIEYCRGRIAVFKRPESIIFVADLPRNPMGKILKRVLREEYGFPIGAKAP